MINYLSLNEISALCPRVYPTQIHTTVCHHSTKTQKNTMRNSGVVFLHDSSYTFIYSLCFAQAILINTMKHGRKGFHQRYLKQILSMDRIVRTFGTIYRNVKYPLWGIQRSRCHISQWWILQRFCKCVFQISFRMCSYSTWAKKLETI